MIKQRMVPNCKQLILLGCLLAMPIAGAAGQEPSVRVEPPQLDGSRMVEQQTQTSVVRDYLQSWKRLDSAFDQNQAALLKEDFVGTALDKLSSTIDQQTKLGIHTRYQERSHDLTIVFYSPEGLSIQLLDTVEYEEQVVDKDKVLTTRPIRKRFLVVLTPSEVRWRVRLFQADGE